MLELVDIGYKINRGGFTTKILDHVSITISPGDLVVITGPNGSGKSTLCKIILGITKPSFGKIFWNDIDITNKSINERANLGISYAFQQPIKFKGLTTFDLINIASGELITPEDAGKFLSKVGLEPSLYLNREIDNKLSGGESKRIEIASVLAKNSDLIIFDEPEAGIDLWSFTDLIQVFKMLKKQGKTLIIISHQEKIMKIADRTLVLDKGRINCVDKLDGILPKLKEVTP